MAQIHARIKPLYLIVRIISTFIYSVCFTFIKDFSSQTQKEISNIIEDKSYFQVVQSRRYS